MPPEEWRPVPGHKGAYEVSDQGHVRSLDRMCAGKNGVSEPHRGTVLTPWVMKAGGYLQVSICRKHRTVHSLVAEAFLGPRPAGYDIMHLNGDRKDNRAANLRYGTRKENLNQTYEYGGTQAAGKLTKQDALDVKRRIAAGESDRSIAERYGVHSAAINHIRNNKTFKWLKEETTNAP